MSFTNFSALTASQKTIWAKDMWKAARNASFINKFAGTGPNAIVQRITDLKKDEKGTRAVMTLVADLTGDGIAGDNQLEGNEEAMKSYEQVIRIDQLRHANVIQGAMAEQKSVVNFRQESRDVLAYWMADRMDQMAFLTMAGITYDNKNTGGSRASGSQLVNLEYAADVSAPTSNRWYRWSASTGLNAGATASVTAADTPSYDMIVNLKAKAKAQYLRGVKGDGGEEVFHLFLHPLAMAKLKLDPKFLANAQYAGPRDKTNSLFAGTGASTLVDGVMVHEFRHVFNTTGLASSSKWGGSGTVEGQAAIFAGAQALGMADIGNPTWVEKNFDYENRPGISTGKIFGFLKPKFYSNYTSQVDDFGLIRIDTAI
jgi:N4-gp56 family major capsid protein